MPDYQLVPVDHDPFGFVPVDHNPFSDHLAAIGRLLDAMTPEWSKPFAGMSPQQANEEARLLQGPQQPGKIGPGYLSDTDRLGMAGVDAASWLLPELKGAAALKGMAGMLPKAGKAAEEAGEVARSPTGKYYIADFVDNEYHGGRRFNSAREAREAAKGIPPNENGVFILRDDGDYSRTVSDAIDENPAGYVHDVVPPRDSQPLLRDVTARGRSGRPLQSAPFSPATDQQILDAGYQRATASPAAKIAGEGGSGAGLGMGNRGAKIQPPIGAQPDFTSPPVADRLPSMKGSSQEEMNASAKAEAARVIDLMRTHGYELVNQKGSPLSEAQYLRFRTDTPPEMSKKGQARLFQEMRDSGLNLANNPTGNEFQVRIAGHKSGSGGYPSSQYEWSLLRSSEDNESRLNSLIGTMRRLASEHPKGGASPFLETNSAPAGIGPAGESLAGPAPPAAKIAGEAGADYARGMAGKPLLVERWGDAKSPMTSVPVEWRQGGGGWKFGIDDNGQAYVTSQFMPDQTRLPRYIDEYLKPLGDDVFFRSALRKDDYAHLQAGTHRGSLNHDTGEPEGGLSVARSPEFPSNYGYFVKGKVIGQGTDGEPLLDLATAKPVSKLMRWGDAQNAFSDARQKRLAELGLSDEQYRALASGAYVIRPGAARNAEVIYGRESPSAVALRGSTAEGPVAQPERSVLVPQPERSATGKSVPDSGYQEVNDLNQPLFRQVIARGRSGRPIASEPLPIGREGEILEAGAGRNPAQASSSGITAYHGSPDDFDKFDVNKTNQGLWFADDPEMARFYKHGQGKLYEVNINASPESFLHREKPIAEQNEAIRRLASEFGVSHDENGGGLYHALASKLAGDGPFREGLVNANNLLRERGVPGIRDSGTHVVFDDSLVKILKKYGLAGMIAGGAYHFQHIPVDHDPFAQ